MLWLGRTHFNDHLGREEQFQPFLGRTSRLRSFCNNNERVTEKMSVFFLSLVMQHLSNASRGIAKIQLEM